MVKARLYHVPLQIPLTPKSVFRLYLIWGQTVSVGLKNPTNWAHHKQTKNLRLKPQANREPAQTKQQKPIRSAVYDL